MTSPKGLDGEVHLAVDAHGMPVRPALIEGSLADCTQALTSTSDLQDPHSGWLSSH